MLSRFFISAALACLGLAATLPAHAADWPSRPITLVVPWAAGGSTDALARLLSQDLGKRLKTEIIVENRPGAGGTIGSMYVASHAKPDGYTFMLGVSGDEVNAEFLYKDLQYSPSRDLAPVGLVAGEALVIAARPGLPAKTVGEIIAQSKQAPLTFSTSGIGSTGHLAGELLNRQTGSVLTAIAYKGAAPAVTDAIAGHVDLTIASPITVAQQIKGGQIKPIAVTSSKRLGVLPDVPTLKESGVDLDVNTWYLMVAPAKTPQPIVQAMSKALAASLADPDMQAKIRALGAEPQSSTPEELAALLKSERTRWGPIITEAHINAQ